ncbi:MAG: hypothetical protein IJ874_08640 [Ruminococcus sp.]|nr:hypothetical protein [Ruminococcus sp.]
MKISGEGLDELLKIAAEDGQRLSGDAGETLTSEEKERIFAMSEKKYKNSKNQTDNTDISAEVSGVERYRRPVWQWTVSIAAAAALVAGSVGGVMLLRHNSPNIGNTPEESSTAISLDYDAIAEEMTDKWLELEYLREYVQTDPVDRIVLTFRNDSTDDSDSECIDFTYRKVTDERFSSLSELKDYICGIVTEDYYEEKYADWLGVEYPVGVGTDPKNFPLYSEARADFMGYAGMLWLDQLWLTPEQQDEPDMYWCQVPVDIEEISDNSITVVRWYDHHSGSIAGGAMRFVITASEGEGINANGWRISSCEYSDKQYAPDEVTTTVTEPAAEQIPIYDDELPTIAEKITDSYAELEKLALYGPETVDTAYPSFTLTDSETGEMITDFNYYEVTDERFSSCEDIRSFYYSVVTENFGNNCDIGNGRFLSRISGDMSEYENKAELTAQSLFKEGDGEYIDYNGKLYSVRPSYPHPDGDDFWLDGDITDINVTARDDNGGVLSFTATRYRNPEAHNSVVYGEEVVYDTDTPASHTNSVL